MTICGFDEAAMEVIALVAIVLINAIFERMHA
jgi:hypothetical protein